MITHSCCYVQTLAEIREEQRAAEAEAPPCSRCHECGSMDKDGNPQGCLGGHPIFFAVLDSTVH